jgi:hypothetical protein
MKNYIIVGVVSLLVGLLLGYGIFFPSGQRLGGGGTTSWATALWSSALWNWQGEVYNSLVNVRAPLASLGTGTTASLDFPVLATSTGGVATTTTVTGLAGAAGDIVLVEPSTYTSGAEYQASVSTASTTTATFTIVGYGTGATAVDPAASTFYLTVLPHASFAAPSALSITATSTATSTH